MRNAASEVKERGRQPLLRLRCGCCGYGVSVRVLPERCPMCGGATWEHQARRPSLGSDDGRLSPWRTTSRD